MISQVIVIQYVTLSKLKWLTGKEKDGTFRTQKACQI